MRLLWFSIPRSSGLGPRFPECVLFLEIVLVGLGSSSFSAGAYELQDVGEEGLRLELAETLSHNPW